MQASVPVWMNEACKMTKWERVNGCRPLATLMLQVSPLHSSYKPATSTARTSMSVARCSCRRVSSLRCSSCTLPNDVAHCKTISVLALNSHLEKATHCKLIALTPLNHVSIPAGRFAKRVSQKVWSYSSAF